MVKDSAGPWILFSMVGLLAGCAPTIHSPSPHNIRPPQFEKTLAALESGSVMPNSPWPTALWWRALKDPALDRVMTMGLRPDNPVLLAAKAQRQWTSAMVQLRRSALGPQLGLSGQMAPLEFSKHGAFGALGLGHRFYDSGTTGLGLQQALDFWGYHHDLVQAALGEAAASQAREADTRRLLAATLVNEYLDWGGAEKIAALLHQQERLAQEQLRLARQRRSLGLDSQLPPQRLERQLQGIIERRIQWQKMATDSRLALAQSAGLGPDQLPIHAPLPSRETPVIVPAQIHLDLFAHRPDVQAALELAKASEAQTKAAQAAFYPNISFSALLYLDSAHLATLFTPGSFAWQFGPAVHLPLFQSGALHAHLHGAEAQQKDAVALYEQTLLAAVRQALEALNDLDKSQQALASANIAWNSGHTSLKLTSVRVGLGLEGRSPYIAEESAQLQRSIQRTQAELSAWKAWSAWQTALGGGYGQ